MNARLIFSACLLLLVAACTTASDRPGVGGGNHPAGQAQKK